MTETGWIYKCDICENVVSVPEPDNLDPGCCEQNMRRLTGEEA